MKSKSIAFRIIGGKFRGKKLVGMSNEKTRPTKDKVREAIFNIIGNKIRDATALDVFAGSGAMGIEAISRGAKHVTFNDIDSEAIKVIKQNLSAIKVENVLVFQKDYYALLSILPDKYDIVFLDPPYDMDIIAQGFLPLLNAGGIIIYERETREVEEGDVRIYGNTTIEIITKTPTDINV